MPADDIYEVVVEATLHSQQIINVYHFRGSSGLSSLQGVINALKDCVVSSLLPALSVDYRLLYVRGKTIYPTLSDEIVVAAGAGDTGGDANQSDVSFAAGLMSLRTGLGGRSNRGRKFIAGIPENGIQSSRLTTPQLAALVAFAACLAGKFVSSFSSSPYFIGVLSRKEIKAGATPLVAFKTVTTFTNSNVVSTQVRRKVGRGS
jgi:hypothetical protein